MNDAIREQLEIMLDADPSITLQDIIDVVLDIAADRAGGPICGEPDCDVCRPILIGEKAEIKGNDLKPRPKGAN